MSRRLGLVRRSAPAVVAAGFLGLACASREQHEGRAVLTVLDRLGRADPTELEALVTELSALPASAPLAREARDRCASAYGALAAARASMARAKEALASDSSVPDALPALARAEQQHKASEAALPACERAHLELTSRIAR